MKSPKRSLGCPVITPILRTPLALVHPLDNLIQFLHESGCWHPTTLCAMINDAQFSSQIVVVDVPDQGASRPAPRIGNLTTGWAGGSQRLAPQVRHSRKGARHDGRSSQTI